MAKDTWALLGVFAAGFLLQAGMILGVYDRLDARIASLDTRLSAEIEAVRTELGADILEVKAGQAAIRERLVRLETLIGLADESLTPVAADEGDRAG